MVDCDSNLVENLARHVLDHVATLYDIAQEFREVTRVAILAYDVEARFDLERLHKLHNIPDATTFGH